MSGGEGPRARFVLHNPSLTAKLRKTFALSAVQATLGTDLTFVGKQLQTPELKWQLDAPVGGIADVRLTSGGFTLRRSPAPSVPQPLSAS